MSRRSKNRNRDQNSNPLRDLDREALQPLRQNSPVVVKPLARLRHVEDLRAWAPAGTPARDVTGRKARIVHKVTSPLVRRGPGGKPLRSATNNWMPKSIEHSRFADVRKTVICLKRKARRSVIFAFKLSGKGARARHKKRNEHSNIRCT